MPSVRRRSRYSSAAQARSADSLLENPRASYASQNNELARLLNIEKAKCSALESERSELFEQIIMLTYANQSLVAALESISDSALKAKEAHLENSSVPSKATNKQGPVTHAKMNKVPQPDQGRTRSPPRHRAATVPPQPSTPELTKGLLFSPSRHRISAKGSAESASSSSLEPGTVPTFLALDQLEIFHEDEEPDFLIPNATIDYIPDDMYCKVSPTREVLGNITNSTNTRRSTSRRASSRILRKKRSENEVVF